VYREPVHHEGKRPEDALTVDDKAHRLEAVIILHGKQAIGE
jgi:hypothetical protein